MKHKKPQNPTRNQKEIIKKAGLDWNNWLVPHGGEDNISLAIINKKSGKRRVIFK